MFAAAVIEVDVKAGMIYGAPAEDLLPHRDTATRRQQSFRDVGRHRHSVVLSLDTEPEQYRQCHLQCG